MSVLNNEDIIKLCSDKEWLKKNKPLIEYHEPKNIKGASYDLRLGSQFYIYGDSDINLENKFEVKHLCDGQQIVIPPGEVCYASTKEILHMPNNLCANLSLPLGLILEGLMLSKQPPIDPGYSGGIICMLHNLSDSKVYIKANAKLLTIEFSELTSTTTKPYEGKYIEKVSLDQYMNKPITSGLFQLRQKTRSMFSRVMTSIPIFLAALSITVAILVAYIAFTNNSTKNSLQIIHNYQQDKVLVIKLPDGTIATLKYETGVNNNIE